VKTALPKVSKANMESPISSYTISLELVAVPEFNSPPRSFTPYERGAFEKWFAEAVTEDWISPASPMARHSSAILFVPKKNSDELRVCVDYRELNPCIKSMIYAPRNDRALRHDIQASTWYAKIDLKNAFYFIKIEPKSRWITTFRTPKGLYQWNVLPMGLRGAPGEFQRFIEELLKEVLGEHVEVYLDDILIHTPKRQECDALYAKVRSILATHRVPVSEKKSHGPATRTVFCGFEYENGTCRPCAVDQTVKGWPQPTNRTALKSFLGATIPFKDHIIGYARTAQPLYACTGKSWIWTHQQTRAFQALKIAMTRVITTSRYDHAAPSTLISDASLFAAAAILMQGGRVCAIWSRAFTAAEKNYTADQRELLAVVDSLTAWRHMLEDSPNIEVNTDNMINATTIRPSSSNRRINRWILTLAQYQLEWRHVPGVTNPADPWSRRPDLRNCI